MNPRWLGCPQSNFHPGRDAAKVQTVIIHTTIGTLAAADARFQNPQSQVSAHYGVGLDGSLVQWVREDDAAFHSGDWSVNLTSIGIEHEDNGLYNADRTDALYATSGALVASICARFDIPIDRAHIKGHREVHPTACPDALDIDRIVREAQGDDMTRDEVIALLGEFGIDKYKVPALVKEFEKHLHASPPSLTGTPIIPPFEGATYFGADTTMKTIGWNDPTTGKTRYFRDGAEVKA